MIITISFLIIGVLIPSMIKRDNFLYVFVFFYPILPEYFAIDLGSSLPLLTVSRLLLIFLFIYVVVKKRFKIRRIKLGKSNGNTAILLYFALTVLTNLTHINKSDSMKNLLLVLLEQGMLLFLITTLADSKEKVEKCIRYLVLASSIMCIGGIIETVTGSNLFYFIATASRQLTMANYTRLSVTRAEATFGHPISFSVYLLLVIPFIMYLVDTRRDMRYRIILVLSIIALLSTISRASIFIFAVCLVIMVASKNRKERVAYYKMFGIALLAFFVAIIIRPTIIELFTQIIYSVLNLVGFNFDLSDFGRNESGVYSRLYQLQLISQTLFRKPIFGFGTGYVYNNTVNIFNGNKYVAVTSIDNEYLLCLIEGGLVSLGAKIGLYVSVWNSLRRNRKRSNLSKAFFFAFSMYFIAIFSVCELTSARMLWTVISLFYCYKSIEFSKEGGQ